MHFCRGGDRPDNARHHEGRRGQQFDRSALGDGLIDQRRDIGLMTDQRVEIGHCLAVILGLWTAPAPRRGPPLFPLSRSLSAGRLHGDLLGLVATNQGCDGREIGIRQDHPQELSRYMSGKSLLYREPPLGYRVPMSLKQIIKAQGRTQRWIARELGISEDTFSRMLLEKQPFPADKVEPLAVLLGIPTLDVLHAVAPSNGSD